MDLFCRECRARSDCTYVQSDLALHSSQQFQFCRTRVNPFANKPWFLRVCSRSLLKTLGKGEIAHNEQFLLFPQCFQPLWRTFLLIHQLKNCHVQTLLVWKTLKFVIWERVKCIVFSLFSSRSRRWVCFLYFWPFRSLSQNLQMTKHYCYLLTTEKKNDSLWLYEKKNHFSHILN